MTERFDLTRVGLTPEQALHISARLGQGALIIYPTDTLYALGCRALDEAATLGLRAAKKRDVYKPLPTIAADLLQARSLAASWPEAANRLVEAFWPGPLTLVVQAAAAVPASLLAGASGIAVRVPACDVARALAALAGPLVSTSANLASEPPCVTVDQALAAFPDAALAIDVGPLDGAPSTIVDLTVPGVVRVLREGRIAREQIAAAQPAGVVSPPH